MSKIVSKLLYQKSLSFKKNRWPKALMPPRGPRGLQAEHWYEHLWQDLREEHLANSLPLGLFRLLSDSLS